MGNEFSAADFAPHLIYPLQFIVYVSTASLTTARALISAGGYHPKMRLRNAQTLRVDVLNDTTAGILVIVHGANTAATLTEGATTDPIGHRSIMTVVDAYKDVASDERIEAYFSTAPGQSGLLIFLEYELIA